MPVVKHKFVSGKADVLDATIVRPSNWNDTHQVTYQVHVVLGADAISLADDVVRFQAGTYAVSLAAATGSGKQIFLCQDGAGTITVNAALGDTIAGQSSIALYAADSYGILVDEAPGIWGFLAGSGGTSTLAYVQKSANYTIGLGDYLVDCIANNFNVTLPVASASLVGRRFEIKNSGSGTVITVLPQAGQKIDGMASQPVASGNAMLVMCTGTGWIIV